MIQVTDCVCLINDQDCKFAISRRHIDDWLEKKMMDNCNIRYLANAHVGTGPIQIILKAVIISS